MSKISEIVSTLEPSSSELEIFDRTLNQFFRPPIRGPFPFRSEATAFINLSSRKVYHDRNYMEKLVSTGLASLEEILEGVFTHEIGHYWGFPRTLEMSMYVSYILDKKFTSRGAEIIFPLYSDYVLDTWLVKEGRNARQIKLLREAGHRLIDQETLDPMTALFYYIYKDELDIDIEDMTSYFDEKINQLIDIARFSVSCIPNTHDIYSLDFESHKDASIDFGNAIMSLLPEMPDLQLGMSLQLLTGNNLRDLDPMEVQKALDVLRKNLSKDEFDQLERYFMNPEGNNRNSIGASGSGLIHGPELSTIKYYRNLARSYGLVIKPKKSRHTSSLVRSRSKSFQPSSRLDTVDYKYSGSGKIIPGLTRAKRKFRYPDPLSGDAIPDALIYKDVSGSMPNPSRTKDMSTIASTIIAESYTRNGSEVGICLFDGLSERVFWSKKIIPLMRQICSYKGGGTRINIERLEEDFEGRELVDFYISSDGGIFNLPQVLEFLQDNSSRCRPIFFHDGRYSLNIPDYDQKTSGVYNGLRVFNVSDESKLIGVTRGIIHSSFPN